MTGNDMLNSYCLWPKKTVGTGIDIKTRTLIFIRDNEEIFARLEDCHK